MVALLGFTLVVGCGSTSGSETAAAKDTRAAASATHVAQKPPPRWLRAVEPPGAQPEITASHRRVARIFAFSDTQLHYLLGKRTFAQSPFAERMSFEVAVRPAALDDGADLLLRLFMNQYRHFYRDHSLVFLGDAADLSCVPEIEAFFDVLADAGQSDLHAVASNHDGFYAGNFTSKRDVDGNLRLTDMPDDWTRACSAPGRFDDRRLTKGRAVKRLHQHVPAPPAAPAGPGAATPAGPDAVSDWVTQASWRGDGPTDFRDAYLYYLRPLSGGEPGAPPAWGVFLDTVDYRSFDFESSLGAGSTGAVSREQLRFLDRAMLDVQVAAGTQPVSFVVFGHHPVRTLEPESRERVTRFFSARPAIVAYVTAHEHDSTERSLTLDGGRVLPEILVGSTTDAPQAAGQLELYVDPRGQRTFVHHRLLLDADARCGEVAPMAPDALGYIGYRLLRDGIPDLDIGIIDKLAFVLGLDDLSAQRIVQGIGALLMENELMRGWAQLYADAPIERDPADDDALAHILGQRYAAGAEVAALEPYLLGRSDSVEHTAYGRWHDPAMAKVLAVAEHGLHRFGPHEALIKRLRARRDSTPAAYDYFLCHAVHAAFAEAKTPRREGNVHYIR
ncbi:MAG: hypothetical protein Tsb0020_14760 [Haliangiales bacterium]